MTNETVKRGLKKVLMENDILCNRVQFSKVEKIDGNVTSIGKITMSLDSIDGIMLDGLKSIVDKFLDDNNIEYKGILLDI